MKTVFRGAMRGSAGTWCRLISDGTYGQMRERFVEKYWSVETQRNVVAMIHSGSYNGERDGSYENYFLKCLNHARYLNQQLNDVDLISQMKWHFPVKVLDRVENRSPRTIEQMARLLASFNNNYFESSNNKARGKDSISNNQGNFKKNVQKNNNEKPSAYNGDTKKGDGSFRKKSEKYKIRNKELRVLNAEDESNSEWTDTVDDVSCGGSSQKSNKKSSEKKVNIDMIKVSYENDTQTCPTIGTNIMSEKSFALVDTGSEVSAISSKYRE